MSARVRAFFRIYDRHGSDPARLQRAYGLFDSSADGPCRCVYHCPVAGKLRLRDWGEVTAWQNAIEARGIRPARDTLF